MWRRPNILSMFGEVLRTYPCCLDFSLSRSYRLAVFEGVCTIEYVDLRRRSPVLPWWSYRSFDFDGTSGVPFLLVFFDNWFRTCTRMLHLQEGSLSHCGTCLRYPGVSYCYERLLYSVSFPRTNSQLGETSPSTQSITQKTNTLMLKMFVYRPYDTPKTSQMFVSAVYHLITMCKQHTSCKSDLGHREK